MKPGESYEIRTTCLNLYRKEEKTPDEGMETQVYYGEVVDIESAENNGRIYVKNRYDGYKGYCDYKTLSKGTVRYIEKDQKELTHAHIPTSTSIPTSASTYAYVCVPRTYIYPIDSIKTIPLMVLGYLSRVEVVECEGKFSKLSCGGWVYSAHLSDKEAFALDPICEAEKFIGTPYLWGGRSGVALDCSAFVQLCLRACGFYCERDTGPQEKTLGVLVSDVYDLSLMKRGDIVFWKGHVAFYMGDGMSIHANATDMAVKVWKQDALVSYIKEVEGSDVCAIRRVL